MMYLYKIDKFTVNFFRFRTKIKQYKPAMSNLKNPLPNFFKFYE